MTTTNDIWIFDIDGVITDPTTKKIIHPQIIERIEQKLNQKIPVCFNTGRSSDWVQKTIVTQFKSDTPLEFLFCACEMGNVILQYNQDNTPRESVHNADLIPSQLYATIKEIVASSYLDSMFVDDTKKSILTIEMKDGFDQDHYEELQSRLSGEIRIILKNYHPGIHVRPSSSNIAIDIKPITSNKELGAEQILTWLKTKNLSLDQFQFITFGDSVSDLQMAELFVSQKLSTIFVYVGEDKINQKAKYQTIITKAHYTTGTMEYLNS